MTDHPVPLTNRQQQQQTTIQQITPLLSCKQSWQTMFYNHNNNLLSLFSECRRVYNATMTVIMFSWDLLPLLSRGLQSLGDCCCGQPLRIPLVMWLYSLSIRCPNMLIMHIIAGYLNYYFIFFMMRWHHPTVLYKPWVTQSDKGLLIRYKHCTHIVL